MAQTESQSVCRDCVQILQHAATLLTPKSLREPLFTTLDTKRHSRLIANASSLSCQLCSLLYAHVPRVSAPLCSEELLVLVVSQARHDPRAATLQLVGLPKGRLHTEVQYCNTLRIQHGRNPAIYTQPQDILKLSLTPSFQLHMGMLKPSNQLPHGLWKH